jgi:hypothetical protein
VTTLFSEWPMPRRWERPIWIKLNARVEALKNRSATSTASIPITIIYARSKFNGWRRHPLKRNELVPAKNVARAAFTLCNPTCPVNIRNCQN